MNTLLSPLWQLHAAPKPADQGYNWIMQQNGAKLIRKVQMWLWMHDSLEWENPAKHVIKKQMSFTTTQPCYD